MRRALLSKGSTLPLHVIPRDILRLYRLVLCDETVESIRTLIVAYFGI
ncbi:unnamed protein product, partial [Musa hybrid cultivar]